MHRSLMAGLVGLAVLASSPLPAAETAAPLWLRYPALSPDGSQIAFSFAGGLWLVPSAGGAARPLVASDVYVSRPVWSPDGQTIAFSADRYGNPDIFVIPADGGAATRLTQDSSPDRPTGFTADGTAILFGARRLGDATATHTLPSPGQNEQLYSVPAAGGRERMVLPILAHEAVEAPGGGRLLYEDQPGIEQAWRKHDLSAQAHDIWLYDEASGQHTRLTGFAGEDRDPAWAPDGQSFYYLSERSGSFNVWQQALDPAAAPLQITHHDTHPVRFLSVSNAGDIAYGYDGELWLLPAGAAEPQKVRVELARDAIDQGPRYVTFDYGASEFDLSPSGREIAFIVRGEVFVMSIDGEVTRRLTSTPEQERSLSFSPDGRSLLYASERDGSWGIYESSLLLDEEPDFFDATLIEERLLLDTLADEFQPLYDPQGERIAFLQNRDEIRLFDIASGEVKTLLGPEFNYSYSDGDTSFSWSPDGRWISASYSPNPNNPDVALIDTRGNQPPINVAPNGFYDFDSSWSADGRYVLWMSDLLGLRRTDQNPDQVDVLVAAVTREASDRLRLGEKDYQRLLDNEAAAEDAAAAEADPESEADEEAAAEDGGAAEDTGVDLGWIEPESENIARRIFRLTPFSASIGYYHLSEDGEYLTYIVYEQGGDGSYTATGYELQHRTSSLTQLFSGLSVDWIDAEMSPDESTLYMLSPWGFYSVSVYDGAVDYISYSAEMPLDRAAEREYIFDHVWRLTQQKFFRRDMGGVDWTFYREAYRKFLPFIDNGYDFAELLSEMVGELNASHTGSGYSGWRSRNDGDQTAYLGLFYDLGWDGAGAKIARVLPGGPADKAGSRIVPGVIIETVDGQAIGAEENLSQYLNTIRGRDTRLGLRDPASGDSWEEVLSPISSWEERDLAYWLWVDERRAMVAELSGGRIGYVHIPDMDEDSYRIAYANILGRYADTEALVVDIRFNGGGNLTNQLLALLSGRQYLTWVPGDKGQTAIEPLGRWTRPSVVLTNPAAYSDGHIFPFSYKELGLGKIVGEPVPGTGTAVWWEDQQDWTIYYGVPQAGFKTNDGTWLENAQLEPDVYVGISPEDKVAGRDPQLAKAVEVLLEELGE